MVPVKFEGCNVTLGEGQPQYQPLPAFASSGPEGGLVFCWKLSFKERLIVLFTGKVWHQVLTFRTALQPQLLTVEKSDVILLKKGQNG